MTNLIKLKADVYALEKAIADERVSHESKIVTLGQKVTKAREAYNLSISGVDIEITAIAESVLYREGYYTAAGEQPSVIRDLIEWLVNQNPANEFRDPKKYYFGCKNYDRWDNQRSDHPYGFGPKHGSTVFALGLKSEFCAKELTEEQRNACIYYLENLKKIDEQKKASRAA